MVRDELSSFIYSVSHDLRAPLRTILGFSEALAEDYGQRLDEQGRDYVERIRSATLRMEHLLESLTELSQISRRELHRQTVSVSDLCASIVASFRRASPGRALHVTIEPALILEGDQTLLESCFRHLIDNAVKFTGKRASAHIEIGSAQQDGRRVIYIRDDGAGFEQAYAGKMFGAFQRLHSNSEFDGLGMGLAIVQRVVSRHGGTVWATGKVGEGATVYLSL